MIGITLSADQIRNAPKDVRQWIEHEVLGALGLAAALPTTAPTQAAHLVACSVEEAEAILRQIEGVLPAVNVFFEFGRPGISYGQPPVMYFRLIDILHHTRLQNIDQVMACLEMINGALAQMRRDTSVRFCAFDNEGHCLIAPQTQASIAALWHNVVAGQRATGAALPTGLFAPAA